MIVRFMNLDKGLLVKEAKNGIINMIQKHQEDGQNTLIKNLETS